MNFVVMLNSKTAGSTSIAKLDTLDDR